MTSPLDTREKIYAEYLSKVTSYVASRVDNIHDREDVIHDIFLKIYAKLDSYDESRASLSTWIYTITKNTVIDYFRSKKLLLQMPEYAAEQAPELDGDLEALTQALQKLDDRERDLIILHYYSGYALKSIADMMSISYIYAKVIHKNAINKMKNLMEENNYERN